MIRGQPYNWSSAKKVWLERELKNDFLNQWLKSLNNILAILFFDFPVSDEFILPSPKSYGLAISLIT